MSRKTILFDLDGTLIDSRESIMLSFEFAFGVCQKPCPSRELISSFVGYPLEIMFEKLGVSKDRIDDFVKAYRNKYEEIYLDITTLLPQAREAIEDAFNFADLAVVTTKNSHFSQILLKHLQVLKYFTCVIGKEDVDEPKPSAKPIMKALEILKKDRENAYMIGDTALDIQAALNAKITPLALSCGYEDIKSLQKYHCEIFSSAKEAVSFIKNL
ncbi:hydrolase [Campylobacter sp. MIT 99-7217]|uniref:HAD family hydrolase n=1 Tax=Campylobacter sp. MIT 99-7217 TaxID=535091 RepID=UPI0011573F2F|nr:HAD family hydrolase [Campylobacter sp. MIT 99-7217]TQR31345.1 hydrolase [Campylobacter sp. MIT 99-7217]